MRLADGEIPFEGRVELFRHGHWGTICDSYFGDEEADVVCRQLGYKTGSVSMATLPGAQGVIWMEPNCTGSEEELSQCQFDCWGCGHCRHDMDAIVRCGKDAQTRLF